MTLCTFDDVIGRLSLAESAFFAVRLFYGVRMHSISLCTPPIGLLSSFRFRKCFELAFDNNSKLAHCLW
jgi:hypothetical protein